jgi:hypothetical protein
MAEQTIQYLPLFVQGLGQFTGVFLGVIAGTLVTVLTHGHQVNSDEKNQLGNLKFELELNEKKLNAWLDELTTYRNHVNGDSLLTYSGYFNFSTFIGVTAFKLHGSGTIYKYFSHEHIGKLQEVYNGLSIDTENFINNQITQRKQKLAHLDNNQSNEQWQSSFKPEIVSEINFWEKKLKSHLLTVREVISIIN